ncbi:MAG: suppressor of fused domain protein, partial [Rubripirellula sp.]
AEQIKRLPFPKAEPDRYWVRTRKGDAGPFTLPKLAKLVAAGRVKPAVMVSRDGKRWKQAQQIPGLPFPAPVQPPVPETPTAVEPCETIATTVTTETPEPEPLAAETTDTQEPEPQTTNTESVATETPEPEPTVTETTDTPEPLVRSAAATTREAEFLCRFGAIGSVDQQANSPIAVQVHRASEVRPVTTIVTSGLSDYSMPTPASANSPRAELVLYTDDVKPEYIHLLRRIAEATIDQNDSLAYGSFYEHGSPIFPGTELDGCLFMIPNISSDFAIRNAVVIDDQPLQLLWVVPTTSLERALIARQGIAVFCQWMDRLGQGLLINPRRSCMAGLARVTN